MHQLLFLFRNFRSYKVSFLWFSFLVFYQFRLTWNKGTWKNRIRVPLRSEMGPMIIPFSYCFDKDMNLEPIEICFILFSKKLYTFGPISVTLYSVIQNTLVCCFSTLALNNKNILIKNISASFLSKVKSVYITFSWSTKICVWLLSTISCVSICTQWIETPKIKVQPKIKRKRASLYYKLVS